MGDLSGRGEVLRQVRYKIARYQAFSAGNGLPIPGLHRIEGAIDLPPNEDVSDLIGTPLLLRLEDGRVLAVILADTAGRVASDAYRQHVEVARRVKRRPAVRRTFHDLDRNRHAAGIGRAAR